jgi:hypothetical protein
VVDDRTQRLWAKQVTMLRESSARLATGSGLASTVDEKWRSSTVLHAGGNGFFILPIGGHLNQGSCLWVRKTRAGWSFELTSKTATAPPTTLRRSRATVERAPVVLDKVLAAWLLSYTAAPRPKSPKAALDSWDGVIERMRRTSENDTAKADLLGSVSPEWMDRCYPRDSGWTFSILRVGDHSWIGLGVWIDLTEHGWLLSLERRDISTVRRSDAPAFVAGRRAEGSTEGTTVLEQVSTTRADAGASLNRLLEVMLASEPLVAGEAATETAQESFRRLLREHVAPALRRDGFRGSGNEYRRTAGEYEIGHPVPEIPLVDKRRRGLRRPRERLAPCDHRALQRGQPGGRRPWQGIRASAGGRLARDAQPPRGDVRLLDASPG